MPPQKEAFMLKKLFLAMMALAVMGFGFVACSDDDDDDEEVTVKYVGTSGAYFELTGSDVYKSGTWSLTTANGSHGSYMSDCKYTVSDSTSDVTINSESKTVYTVTFTYTTTSTGAAGSSTGYLSSDKTIIYYGHGTTYSEYTKQ